MSRPHVLNSLQLRARGWLIRNDPTPEGFWESAPLDSDFVGDVRQNLESFGPHGGGTRIIREWDRHTGRRGG